MTQLRKSAPFKLSASLKIVRKRNDYSDDIERSNDVFTVNLKPKSNFVTENLASAKLKWHLSLRLKIEKKNQNP